MRSWSWVLRERGPTGLAKIIAMDDNEQMLAIIARTLRGEHNVSPAGDGKAGLALFDRQGADLVLVDLNMPEMDGMEVIRALRARQADLPIVAISGGGPFPTDVNLKTAELLGASAILQKPLDHGRLRAVVADLLAD